MRQHQQRLIGRARYLRPITPASLMSKSEPTRKEMYYNVMYNMCKLEYNQHNTPPQAFHMDGFRLQFSLFSLWVREDGDRGRTAAEVL